jgi:SsrA-binding protein
LGKANITELCEFSNSELFAINTYIEEYTFETNSTTKREANRVLLKKKGIEGLLKVFKPKDLP